MNLTAQAKFTNLNIRPELAGNERGQTGVDIALETSLLEKAFGEFFPEPDNVDSDYTRLCDALWDTGNEIRNHHITGIKLAQQFTVRARIGGDLISESVELDECTLNKIAFTPQTGGVADVTFRLQCHPTTAQIGALSQLLGNTVDVALESVEAAGERAPTSPDLLDGEAA